MASVSWNNNGSWRRATVSNSGNCGSVDTVTGRLLGSNAGVRFVELKCQQTTQPNIKFGFRDATYVGYSYSPISSITSVPDGGTISGSVHLWYDGDPKYISGYNWDIYSFSDKTAEGQNTYIPGNTSLAVSKVYAIHKGSFPDYTSDIYMGCWGTKSTSATTYYDYKMSDQSMYDDWITYDNKYNASNGLGSIYFAITCRSFSINPLTTMSVKKGCTYRFNLHTYSEANCDGIIISKASLSYSSFSTLKNNANVICYCDGVNANKTYSWYTPQSDGILYIYFIVDGSVAPGKGLNFISSYTQSSIDVYKYEKYDLYTYGDVEVECYKFVIEYIETDEQGGSGGGNQAQVIEYGANPDDDGWAFDAPTKTGYTFLGYYSSPTGGTQYYNSDAECIRGIDILETEVTLYAHWGNTITNAGTFVSPTVYCTSLPKAAYYTDSQKTATIVSTVGSCNVGSLTYTKASGNANLTVSGTSVVVAANTTNGTYTIGITVTSPSGTGGDGYPYFSMTASRSVSVWVRAVYMTGRGEINTYPTPNQQPVQHTNFPATQFWICPVDYYSNWSYNWGNWFTVPDVKQNLTYNNGTGGYVNAAAMTPLSSLDNYTGSNYRRHEVFQSLGKTPTPTELGNPYAEPLSQYRDYVNQEVYDLIMNWITDYVDVNTGDYGTNSLNTGGYQHYNSYSYSSTWNINYYQVLYSDRLDWYGLAVQPEYIQYGGSGSASSSGWEEPNTTMRLCEFIYDNFPSDGNYDLEADWQNFTTIYDLIMYVNDNLDDTINGGLTTHYTLELTEGLRTANQMTITFGGNTSGTMRYETSDHNDIIVNVSYTSGQSENITTQLTATSSSSNDKRIYPTTSGIVNISGPFNNGE